MPRTDRDKRFRQGVATGLRIAYLYVARSEPIDKKEVLTAIEEHHDELAVDKRDDEIARIRHFPGLQDVWNEWNKDIDVRKKAVKAGAKKRSQES